MKIIYYQMSRIAQLLKTYTYNQAKPSLTVPPLTVYDAESKENGLKFTLKLYRKADSDLFSYLQKLKSSGSDFVVKIYELLHEPETNQLLMIQQAVPYGTLAAAIAKSKRLQDEDAVLVSKQLLNGHIDLLRNGLYWTGSEADIDVTENGIKLSWNNSMVYSENNPNPFPEIIGRLGLRTEKEGILPFPNSKMIQDLIKVSKQNASQMSLHPLLKKREKVFKKKGNNWLAIKQYKVKGEYAQELTYTAISKEYGLVRVKVFEKGDIDQELIKVYQTRPAFTKLLAYYDQGENWITVSEYANDGNVQSYVKRLKTNAIQLKENHIQFIFFSLIQPLKYINSTSITSFNMLHIKNVYIYNGIPKIGEISPLNERLREALTQKADVPDFYHREFKEAPATRDAKYDTYSLGVLLYKLMYTEYPIFPEGSVHIPTTPNYKKTLKDALVLFLNKGGNLTDLEKELEVSDDIKNQVKQNEKKLNNISKMVGGRQVLLDEAIDRAEHHSQLSIGLDEERLQKEKQTDCLGRLWNRLNTRGKDSEGIYRRLHQSNFAFYRQCTVAIVISLFYFLAFFLPYLIGFFDLMSKTQLFFSAYFYVLGKRHRAIISNYDDFLGGLSSLGTVNDVSQVRDGMGCLIDDTGSYYSFFKPSYHWYAYLIVSVIIMVVIIVLKGIQAGKFSLLRTLYHHYDETIDGANEARFATSSYVFFQLWYFLSLFGFFYLFNFIFNEQTSPCLGGKGWSQLTTTLATDRLKFMLEYFIIIIFTFSMFILVYLQVCKFYGKIPYNSLLNPIFVYSPIYLALFILMRIGAYSNFTPSFSNNTAGMIGSNYINFMGYFPEIFWLVQIGLEGIIDFIFLRCMDKKIETFVLSQVSDEIKA